MSIIPIITFKAGICDVDQSSKPYKITPQAKPGYIYLYSEDDLIHFCWRPRDVPLDEPELDLVMIPGDGNFVAYNTRSPSQSSSKTDGRIFVLKFASSSQRHLFWLQSKPQGRNGNPAYLSPRDLKIRDVVDKLLQGEEVNINRELASVRNRNNEDEDSRRDGDDDETMEDVEGAGDSHGHHEGGSGGAGPGATGGDFREEGEDAREGGADGARAASSDAATVVRDFLASLKGAPALGSAQAQQGGKLYPLLNDLLGTSVTIPMLDGASDEYVDNLLSFLPPTVLILAQQGDSGNAIAKEPSAEAVTAAREALSSTQKRALLKKVLRSPQFTQSLASLSVALRDGGLPSIAEALGVAVENGGLVRGGAVPLGGGDAVEAFVNGVKKTVQKK
ncbi:proteasome complex subunit Rpn13 ubiquitin receptor-domain-containing protein [Lasiosphaeria hispida]|uniref:Proteasome complex subunit Rpn13 ubiquitin receptor-domain-containing protein n=1 Tax=Lasiosphaeria hispida TaxID=260671 RepID=A0AAJ0M8A1_9PEZI|nr:proteasome complex subunit Rpn13 ubiquitin receptor-domain-containing protein [Lasiosphaeria hispida]